MPLILAIEPDRRQASQLKKLVKGVGAELVLADTTERALDAIGNRIPDLVLVPALLSPQDDAALATALRVIATAAHVQTLTIPVFASPTARTHSSSSGGVLAKWLGERTQASAPEGCNPAVFAEQIAAYLAEAAAARDARTADAEEYEPPAPKAIAEPVHVAQPFEVEPWLDTAADEVAGMTAMNEPAPAESAPARESFEYESEPGVVSVEDDSEPAVPSFTNDSEPTVRFFKDESEPVVLSFQRERTQPLDIAPEPLSGSDFEWQPIEIPEEEALDATADAAAGSDASADRDRPADRYATIALDPRDIDLGAFLADLGREPIVGAEIELESFEPIDRVHAAPDVEEPAFVNDSALVADESATLIEYSIAAVDPPESIDEQPAMAAAASEEKPARDPIAEFERWMTLPIPRQRTRPKPDAEMADPRIPEPEAAPVVERASAAPAEPEARQVDVQARPDPAASEWVDMLDALRRDIDRLRIERTAVPVQAAARSTPRTVPQPAPPSPSQPVQAVAAAAVDSAQAPARKKKRKKEPRPVQDEWGFFDPAQCGFTALLAKLDEINEANDESW